MNIEWALILTFVVVIIVIFVAYFCANLRLFASLALALLFGLITLNLFYPLNQLADQEANPSLWAYGVYQITAFFILLIYVLWTGLYSTKTVA